MKRAVCALVHRFDDLYLAVTRPHDHSIWGLPGGHVEEGEGFHAAVKREMKEETGLDVVGIGLFPLYHGPNHDFEVTTFHCLVQGVIHTEETGLIEWVPRTRLVTGPFGEYNKALFEAYDRARGTDEFESWQRAKATPEASLC